MSGIWKTAFASHILHFTSKLINWLRLRRVINLILTKFNPQPIKYPHSWNEPIRGRTWKTNLKTCLRQKFQQSDFQHFSLNVNTNISNPDLWKSRQKFSVQTFAWSHLWQCVGVSDVIQLFHRLFRTMVDHLILFYFDY